MNHLEKLRVLPVFMAAGALFYLGSKAPTDTVIPMLYGLGGALSTGVGIAMLLIDVKYGEPK